MIYDDTLTMTRQFLPHMAAGMEVAPIFYFPIVAHKVLRKDNCASFKAGLRMPYNVIIIEDLASCVAIGRADNRSEGAEGEWIFVLMEYSGVNRVKGATNDPEAEELCDEFISPGTGLVAMGNLEVQSVERGDLAYRASGTAITGLVDDPSTWREAAWADSPSRFGPRLGGNAMTALEEVFHVQNLPRFTGWPTEIGPLNQRFTIADNGHIDLTD